MDITLNDDDGSANLRCAKCKHRVESLETAMMMYLTKFKRFSSCAGCCNHYTPLHVSSISSPNSDVT